MAQRVRTAASCGRLSFNRSIRDNPNRLVAIRQQDVINDHLQSVVTKSKGAGEALTAIAAAEQPLLPRRPG